MLHLVIDPEEERIEAAAAQCVAEQIHRIATSAELVAALRAAFFAGLTAARTSENTSQEAA